MTIDSCGNSSVNSRSSANSTNCRNPTLGQLAAGIGTEELLARYPYLEREDVLAALRCAAASTA